MAGPKNSQDSDRRRGGPVEAEVAFWRSALRDPVLRRMTVEACGVFRSLLALVFRRSGPYYGCLRVTGEGPHSGRTLAAALRVPTRAMKAYLHELAERGLLERAEVNGRPYWRVVDYETWATGGRGGRAVGPPEKPRCPQCHELLPESGPCPHCSIAPATLQRQEWLDAVARAPALVQYREPLDRLVGHRLEPGDADSIREALGVVARPATREPAEGLAFGRAHA